MKPAPHFDRLASPYRLLERLTFGRALERCRTTFLPELASCRSALLLGDGDGRFAARLLATNTALLADAVDASPAMLRALVLNAGLHAGRVRVHVADARLFTPPHPPYDLIATHFFLDCLSTAEVAALASNLRACATPRTRWVLSEFAVPPGRFGTLIARPLVTALYCAFALFTGLRVLRLPACAQALAAAGFTRIQQRQFLRGLLVAELWTLGPAAPQQPLH